MLTAFTLWCAGGNLIISMLCGPFLVIIGVKEGFYWLYSTDTVNVSDIAIPGFPTHGLFISEIGDILIAYFILKLPMPGKSDAG